MTRSMSEESNFLNEKAQALQDGSDSFYEKLNLIDPDDKDQRRALIKSQIDELSGVLRDIQNLLARDAEFRVGK